MDSSLEICAGGCQLLLYMQLQNVPTIRSEINFHQRSDVTTYLSHTTYLRDADDVHSQQQCGQQTHSDFKEKLSETMIKKYNDYKC